MAGKVELSEADVLALLREACAAAGGQAAWAREHGVPRSYVTNILKGRDRPSDGVLSALGMERAVVYRRALNQPGA